MDKYILEDTKGERSDPMGDQRSLEEVREDAVEKQMCALRELGKDHEPELKSQIIESIEERGEMIRYLDEHTSKQ